MKALVDSLALDVLSFFGMLLGIGLLIVCLFAAELRILAVPGLALLLPSLIYGMR
jgi:hypothetical protein